MSRRMKTCAFTRAMSKTISEVDTSLNEVTTFDGGPGQEDTFMAKMYDSDPINRKKH